MCYQEYRPHQCRHCGSEWYAPETVETCEEGEAILQKYGYCAHLASLLHDAGHNVSMGRSSRRLEDMCEECKKAHVKAWELESVDKVPIGQPL